MGIPAWRAPLMPWMLIATGLFEGLGLLTLLTLLWAPDTAGATIAVSGIALAAVNAVFWHRYKSTAAKQGITPLARAVLERITPSLHLIGHAVPLAVFSLALLWDTNPSVSLAFAGIAALAGGVLWKVTVITRACHQQGFRLDRFPQRGSGTYAAITRTAG